VGDEKVVRNRPGRSNSKVNPNGGNPGSLELSVTFAKAGSTLLACPPLRTQLIASWHVFVLGHDETI